jgi:hypothetical protein
MIVIFRKKRLEAELAALRADLKEQLERSLKTVSEEADGRLARDLEQMEKEVGSRAARMEKAFAEAENKLGNLREALNQNDARSQEAFLHLRAAEERLNDQAAKLAEGTAEVENKLRGSREYLNEQNERLQHFFRQQQAAEQRLSEQLAKLDVLTQTAVQNLERAMSLERQIEDSARAATAKCVAEIGDKAADATYTTVESLSKASEWYEKKLQTRTEITLAKSLEQAANNLREKDEAAFREFCVKADAKVSELSTSLEMQSAQIRAASEVVGQQLAAQLRAALTEAQSTLSQANLDVLTKIDQAMKQYEQNAVSKFSQESQERMEMLVRSAEQRLLQTCNDVFTEIGDRLRQKFLESEAPRPAAKATQA